MDSPAGRHHSGFSNIAIPSVYEVLELTSDKKQKESLPLLQVVAGKGLSDVCSCSDACLR